MARENARTKADRRRTFYAACPTPECARCVPVGEPCPDCTRNTPTTESENP